jgi:hypothetical protein
MDHEDCIAEHFVIYNSNQAGVAFTGNTRDGWYYVGYPESLSAQLDRDWWKAVFLNSQDNLGKAIIWSKHQFGTGANIRKHCEWTFNLLGEPAMPIWTDTPDSFDVTHPSELLIGSSSFTVHVEKVGGGNIQDAYVCLWKDDEVYLRDYTNYNGDVTFNPSPSTGGILYVTVTKHNYLPYEGSAQVSYDSPPEIIDNTPSIATTGDSFTFNATVTDNIEVSNVYVEYWYGSGIHTNVSMNNVANDYWEKTIIIDDTIDVLHYIISANDTSDNWNNTGINDVTIIDNDKPEITNVQDSPDPQELGGYINISANVTDNIGVDEVYLNITYPNGNNMNFSIKQNRTGDTYYCNKTYSGVGTYNYFIWANDTSGNENISDTYYFEIQPEEIQHTFTFNQGWNLITIPVENNYTAETLGQAIGGSSICDTITMWNSTRQKYVGHPVGTPVSNFDIENGVGYFVHVMQDTNFTVTGMPIEAVSVPLHVGWNIIGWYHEYVTKAESLGTNITSCDTVTMWNASKQKYVGHPVGTPVSNFDIMMGMGIFVHVTTDSIWHGEG